MLLLMRAATVCFCYWCCYRQSLWQLLLLLLLLLLLRLLLLLLLLLRLLLMQELPTQCRNKHRVAIQLRLNISPVDCVEVFQI